MRCHYWLFNTHNIRETVDSFARGPYYHIFKRYVFLFCWQKCGPRPKLFLGLDIFSTLIDHIILTYLRKSFIPDKKNQISILTMVSEFALSQTQTTLQDHFLQASKTYTNSSIAPSKPIQKNIISTLKKSWILQHSLPLKNCSSENVWCNSSPPQAIFDSKFFHSLSSWRNNNHDRATVDRTPFSIEQLSEHE